MAETVNQASENSVFAGGAGGEAPDGTGTTEPSSWELYWLWE